MTANQDSTTQVGHCKQDDTDVYIGRGDHGNAHFLNTDIGDRGWLGNPFTVDDHGREDCVERFRTKFEAAIATDAELCDAVAALRGKTLGCWCQRLTDDGPRCHGEVIAEWADHLG